MIRTSILPVSLVQEQNLGAFLDMSDAIRSTSGEPYLPNIWTCLWHLAPGFPCLLSWLDLWWGFCPGLIKILQDGSDMGPMHPLFLMAWMAVLLSILHVRTVYFNWGNRTKNRSRLQFFLILMMNYPGIAIKPDTNAQFWCICSNCFWCWNQGDGRGQSRWQIMPRHEVPPSPLLIHPCMYHRSSIVPMYHTCSGSCQKYGTGCAVGSPQAPCHSPAIAFLSGFTKSCHCKVCKGLC